MKFLKILMYGYDKTALSEKEWKRLDITIHLGGEFPLTPREFLAHLH